MQEKTIIAILDCLIPGDNTGWPPAGQHGLAARFLELLKTLFIDGPEQLQAVLLQLPEDFQTLTNVKQAASLKEVEKNKFDIFYRYNLHLKGRDF